jgi:hypothetical protein
LNVKIPVLGQKIAFEKCCHKIKSTYTARDFAFLTNALT